MSHDRLKEILYGMKKRCYNPNSSSYSNYGGRGIEICDEWLNDTNSFVTWALGNGYNENLTIERIDNNGNYEPSNCKWITRVEQANNKRNNVHVQIDGQEVNLSELAKALGLAGATIYTRYYSGLRGIELIRLSDKRKKQESLVDISGEIYNLRELSEVSGIKYSTIKGRYLQGDRGERLIRPLEKNKARIKKCNS